MEPIGPAVGFDGACLEEGDSAPPGEEAEAIGCSKTGLMPELGEEVLLARDGD
jgi:hypothetical protein